MGDKEIEPQIVKRGEDVQQGNGIRPARNGNDDRIAGTEQPVFSNVPGNLFTCGIRSLSLLPESALFGHGSRQGEMLRTGTKQKTPSFREKRGDLVAAQGLEPRTTRI